MKNTVGLASVLVLGTTLVITLGDGLNLAELFTALARDLAVVTGP